MRKENSEYHQEYYKKSTKKIKAFMLSLFIITLITIIFFTFYDGFELPNITGEMISLPKVAGNTSVELEISAPEIGLKLDDANLKIDFFMNQDFLLDGKILSSDRPNGPIILEGFTGEIFINKQVINAFSGKVSKIYVGGVPLYNEKENKMEISTKSEMKYSSLEINSEVYFQELNFEGKGDIIAGGSSLKIDGEQVVLNNFLGKLCFKKELLFISGATTKIEISGNGKKISISE